MAGKKFHYKYWKTLSFQEQVDKIKPADSVPEELVIEQKTTLNYSDQTATKYSKKKKTATTIHLEIKQLVKNNNLDQARLILKKALQNGYKGKRLDHWSKELAMGSSVKSMREKKKDLTNLPAAAKIDPPKDDLTEYIEERDQEEPGFKATVEKIEEKILQNKENDDNKEHSKEIKQMVDFEIPDLPLEDEAESVADPTVQDESGGSVVFGILGAGQCGGRLAESFYKLGYKKAVVVNTAEHDLNGLSIIPEDHKILMTTEAGGGAGKDMRKGEQAADQAQQEIYEKMQKIFGPVDRVMVCAGAGGGTGGGACLRLVETAKKYLSYLGVENVNSKVGVLLTLPTKGESGSPELAENAHLLGTKLCELAASGEVSPLLIFDNDKIKKKYPQLTVKNFWPTVNATVTGLFHMFNVLSKQSSEVTSFDPADYNRVLGAGGCMIMGLTTLTEYADGTDVSKAIRRNLEKGLLCGGFDIQTASAAACIATAPSDILENTPGLMDSLETGFDTLANITGNATVFRGIYEVNKNKFVVYTALTGLATPQKRLDELKRSSTNKITKTKLYS